MNVSVILVAYHGDSWLPACLDSLVQSSKKRLHLVLVDNAGNTIIPQLDLSKFDAEVLKTPAPMGFADANNFALTQASHLESVVLFLNQDTISPPHWVDYCLTCFEQDAQMGAISPMIRTYDDSDWDPSFLDCLPADTTKFLTDPVSEASSTFYTKNVPAPSLLVRTEVLHEAGPFDPIFGSYYEDYDLCRRVRMAGYQVGFSQKARIQHFSGSTTTTREREIKRMRQIIRNRVLFQMRDSGKPRFPLFLKYLFMDFPRRFVRGVLRTPSSQPPGVTLKAYGDLLSIAGRLTSRRRDEAAWQAYLSELSWSNRISGLALRK